MGLIDDLDRRRAQVEITRENRSRIAQAYGSFSSTGLGTFHYPDRLGFGLSFIEKPYVCHAGEVDLEALTDVLGIVPPATVPLPHLTGYVSRWDQDDRDLYVGCWVSVRVEFPVVDLIDPSVLPVIEHHFTFAAIAMKHIPLDGADKVVN